MLQDYQFGYEVAGYDEYGLPNHHARQEQRDGNTVKGQYTVSTVHNKGQYTVSTVHNKG